MHCGILSFYRFYLYTVDFVFYDFPCIEDFDFLRFPFRTADCEFLRFSLYEFYFYCTIWFLYCGLLFFTLFPVTRDFELLRFTPCGGDFWFLQFPIHRVLYRVPVYRKCQKSIEIESFVYGIVLLTENITESEIFYRVPLYWKFRKLIKIEGFMKCKSACFYKLLPIWLRARGGG